MTTRRYVVISPCRDEEEYLPATLASVANQTEPPALWVLVDDGSSDRTPEILTEFAREHDYARVLTRPPRATRVLGPAVVDTFNAGLATVDLDDYDYVVKLDVDLDLPPGYFARLMDHMEADPRLASASGVACTRRPDGTLVPERGSFEITVGMSKFYRVEAFRDIGGFVPLLMWDGIDCHTARSRGWKARSFDETDLRFAHLRPMGSSDRSLLRGKRRHGKGQYLMGTHPLFFLASVVARTRDEPRVLGAVHTLAGYVGAALRGETRHDDPVMQRQLRRWQLESLRLGKGVATQRWEDREAATWRTTHGAPEGQATPTMPLRESENSRRAPRPSRSASHADARRG